MNVLYTAKAKQWNEGTALLDQATRRLEEVLGPAADRVTAEWDRAEDQKGRLVYTLRISDWTGSATASFAPDELGSPTHMRVRLNRLWGDLLQARSHKQLEELQGAGGSES